MPCPICDQKPANCDCSEAEKRMHSEIEELKEQLPRWIPVTERLPEDLQRVIAYFAGVGIDEVGEAVFNKAGGWFSTEHGAWDASHWMPMPEPPAQ